MFGIAGIGGTTTADAITDGAEVVMGKIGTGAEIADAEDCGMGPDDVDAEAGAAAPIPRLRSNALSSSISAFMAANSFATAGGISSFDAEFVSSGLTDIVSEFDVTV